MFTKEYLDSLPKRIPIEERLASKTKVTESGCHEYDGVKDRCGYGRFKIGKHSLGAHKVSYLTRVGDYDQNLELMHSCDNPACINVDHLTPATHQENMQDCVDKGRHTSQHLDSPRQAAIESGMELYYGSVCEIHGYDLRSVKNGACVFCRDDYNAKKREQRRVARESAA
ncbi:putative HNH endonuclease [Erwinia phage Wellington]|uniref:Putative HNH endonuclease n=2 Tax=Wellingtonvirus wellington TaxID=2734153 RepID=A0A1B2IEH2_9CAUD|nr:HNH endonuclease [Erwinia phage vB_EamM_Kwan]YP_009806777.1 HNH endonuclease [Erwinia phage Wellington]ANZ49642.1 putative HNH endonuclease [Erwinia phage vB_EamM_Kwan]AXF51417.1 putative HNH endonuclease [Erwinia phage Wellington]